jgi:8-oxo-dGTP diphosphatase
MKNARPVQTDAPIPAIVAIIRSDDRYLFVKRADHLVAGAGFWSPVSGRVEPHESEPEALVREVREEVGLIVEPGRKVRAIPTSDGRFMLSFGTTRVVAGTARVHSDEISELRWVTLDEMTALQPHFEEDLAIIRDVSAA